ncbi:hypothetical protein [Staphylococcus saprophyticus]|uniref:hypothetical protein n=1 Tax=Staphylococcus saprophyticus TaxID=29385 RepID=UPI00280A6E74|nr:hypothetical protein [Staphylococcus saprophyticus]WMM14411.1 hypothetical protein RCG45_06425 [Staphylococcus saprophyticus]
MAYEYEKTIKEELEFTDLDNTDNQDKMLKELQEVYNKAKAFDEILNIDLTQHDEEYADNVMKVVNKFTEGKND